MKVSLSWLKELVKYDLSDQALAEKLSLNSIGVKSQTRDYLELDLTYNRGDLLSMRGVAREVAAITGSQIMFSDEEVKERGDVLETKVEVKNNKLCPLYCIAKIENLKVEHPDETWVKKLSDCGIRSINNIADVTNLIMMEYGQPMHAFDARAIKDEAIIVRTAKQGEKITTLDGKIRDLDTTDLLITDSLNPLGITGVMGGKDSEINDSTTTILLEAAIFDPVSNRNSAKRHGLSTEASKRFQHGLAKTNLLQALATAIKMYEGLGGKLTAISLVGDLEDSPKAVNLTQQKINSLLGSEVDPELVEKYLKKLGFNLASKGDALRAWDVSVPYWRLDINIEEDLIEEIARMYGYDRIDGQPLKGENPQEIDQSFYNFIYDLKVNLKNAGLTEVQTYSFYSTSVLNVLRFDSSSKESLVKVANPISSETEYLRENLWPNLVEVVGKNIRKGYKDIAIFEIGKAFSVGPDGSPKENYRLAIALMNDTDNPLAELYQMAQNLSLHPNVGLSPNKEGSLKPVQLLHPKRQIGNLAEVHLRVLNKLGIEKRVAVLEINL